MENSKKSPTDFNPNTDWFMEAKYGLFVHYLFEIQNAKKMKSGAEYDRTIKFNDRGKWCEYITSFDMGLQQGKITNWNTCVNDFDVETFASIAYEAGAGYVMFSLGQCSGYICSPNSKYDYYTGSKTGERCSERDLINDLYVALNAKGIKLMLYFISHTPYTADVSVTKSLGSDTIAANQCHYLPTPEFREKWSEIIKEWSDRYGDKVSGWWFDGYYSDDLMLDDTYCSAFAKAAKSGNSKSIVAFNPGLMIKKATVSDDYSAGEYEEMSLYPEERWIDGVQWHCLTFMGDFWAYTNSKYTAEEVVDYVKKCNEKQGVVTIDVGVYRDGSVSDTQMSVLKQLKSEIRIKD